VIPGKEMIISLHGMQKQIQSELGITTNSDSYQAWVQTNYGSRRATRSEEAGSSLLEISKPGENKESHEARLVPKTFSPMSSFAIEGLYIY
jgi:hypothetical protein